MQAQLLDPRNDTDTSARANPASTWFGVEEQGPLPLLAVGEHRGTYKLLALLLDLGLLSAVYYAALLLAKMEHPVGIYVGAPEYLLQLPLGLALCWCAALLATRAYDNSRTSSLLAAARRSGRSAAFMCSLLMVLLFVFKVQFVSRKFIAFYSLVSVAALTMNRISELKLLRLARSTGMNTVSVVLVGQGESLVRQWAELEQNREWGYRVAGVVATGSLAGAAHEIGLRELGQVANLPEILRTRIVDEVIICDPNLALDSEVLKTLRVAGKRVRISLPPPMQGWHIGNGGHLGSQQMLMLECRKPAPLYRVFKTTVEWLAALGLVLALGLPMLAIALAIRMTMGPGVLFVQKRAGKNGRAFFLYKFRTMVKDARKLQAQLDAQNIMGSVAFKSKTDPRVTPLGNFLRRYSLDELPQLLNVLRGDIGLVGPRPMAMYEARKVPTWARRRFSVRPGITCLWQVMGRNQLPFEEWMRLDLRYVDEWTPSLDMMILAKTPSAVFSSKGAY